MSESILDRCKRQWRMMPRNSAEQQAITEIERLTAENRELKRALNEIRNRQPSKKVRIVDNEWCDCPPGVCSGGEIMTCRINSPLLNFVSTRRERYDAEEEAGKERMRTWLGEGDD